MTRPKIGGYNWRASLQTLIQREREEAKALRELVKHAKTDATKDLLAALLANKVETISTLHEMLEESRR